MKNSRHQWLKIIFISLFNIVLALVSTAIAAVSKFAIDAAYKSSIATTKSLKDRYFKEIVFFGIIILVIILLRMIIRIVAQSITVRVAAELNMSIRMNLFKNIMRKKYEDINQYHSGELINRITSDVSVVSNGMTTIIPNLLYFITQFVGAFAVLIVFDWKFTLLFIVSGLVMASVTVLFREKLKHLHKKVQESDGRVRSFFQEAIESLLVIKTFDANKQFASKGDKLQDVNYRYQMKRRAVSITANAGFSFIFNAGYLLALLWCAIRVTIGNMTFGTLTAVLQLVSQIQTPFVNVTKVLPEYYSIIASAERIMEIEHIEEENVEYRVDPDKFYKEFSQATFDNIAFGYGRETVLKSGNACFNKGDFVAIRGISGIGKSTLMKLLLGVYSPNHGEIRLYTKNGNFIHADATTRSLFSYVPQGNCLFSGTLRDNMRLFNPKVTDEEIYEAFKISHIYDFVDSLPDKLDTVLSEGGRGVSEGQAQRIAIARALVSKAPILLLDEATSALDEKTEKIVLKNIQSLKQKTCIIITHKSAALDVCDKEFIIKDKVLSCR